MSFGDVGVGQAIVSTFKSRVRQPVDIYCPVGGHFCDSSGIYVVRICANGLQFVCRGDVARSKANDQISGNQPKHVHFLYANLFLPGHISVNAFPSLTDHTILP